MQKGKYMSKKVNTKKKKYCSPRLLSSSLKPTSFYNSRSDFQDGESYLLSAVWC